MKAAYTILGFGLLLFLSACSKDTNTVVVPQDNTPPQSENEKFIYKDGNWFLWGGTDESDHFNVTNMDLNRDNFKYGIGRENFKVLEEPQYVSIESLSEIYKDDDEVIIIHADQGILAYPLDLLIAHELINETIDGQATMVSYCVLADFVGIYSRDYCGRTLTFAVSGYTYWEEKVWNDRDGFVLWDRDTESLWWPLRGTAISGNMRNVPLSKNLTFTWERKDWTYLAVNHPEAAVLAPYQIPDPIIDYPIIAPENLNCQ